MWTKTIQSVAEQLCLILKDYDVSYKVAELYIQKRVEDSTEECRKYHFDCLTLRQMPKKENKRTIALIHHPLSRCSDRTAIWGPITNAKKNTFSAMIRFMSSERGVRTPYWRIYASAWGVKDLDKDKITIRDKLNDMKIIPISILKQISPARGVGAAARPNFWYYS